MLSLGIDIGSSSIKASVIDLETKKLVGTDFYPKQEMKILAPKQGWAEQDPDTWWSNIIILLKQLFKTRQINAREINFIGISYQMHGLIALDKNGKVLRPAIIWCDSRAVSIGKNALKELGTEMLDSLLNSPGNFTASKLKWVQENEPEIYDQIDKIMLPGDFIAYKLTGEINTTQSGLSEAILWDFKTNSISEALLDYYTIDKDLIPPVIDTFSNQGKVLPNIADEFGLNKSTIVSYRAGDQPNNALSLNVLETGEVAATAGTSGVVYGISDKVKYDTQSRVNTFMHVNHSTANTRLGVLLNINGAGIMNAWLRKNIAQDLSYEQINEEAGKVPVGSDGLMVFPFGNGAERVFGNKDLGAGIHNLNLNIHTQNHMLRASQESIAFSFKYGMDILKEIGINTSIIRAGYSNMFLSPLFSKTLADIAVTSIELIDTDGSQGAARAAAYGGEYYKSLSEALSGINIIKIIRPEKNDLITQAYIKWKIALDNLIKNINS